MFKIFEKDGKINFVDDNNVLVGFDYRASCCECFGYFISELEPVNCQNISYDHEPIGGNYNLIICSEYDFSEYNFDTNYFKNDFNEYVIFKITNNQKSLYLCLYNHHNGYYGHGFHMEIGGKTIASGVL